VGEKAVDQVIIDFWYLYPFCKYLQSKFEVWNLANLCMFWLHFYYKKKAPNFKTQFSKFDMLTIMWQNLMTIRRWSL